MDLNLSKSVMDLMFWGRLFHNFGAIFSKALSPNVWYQSNFALIWLVQMIHSELGYFACSLISGFPATTQRLSQVCLFMMFYQALPLFIVTFKSEFKGKLQTIFYNLTLGGT